MKEWMTAREIAELALPGLPGSRQGIDARAKEQAWPFRERQASGGGREYPIVALPETARNECLRRQIGTRRTLPLVIEEQPLQALSDLKGWQRDIMNARLVLVREVVRLSRLGGKMRAVGMVVEQGNAGTLAPELQRAVEAASAKRGSRAPLSERTLLRWISDFEAAGEKPEALAPAPSPREQHLPPEWLADFLDYYALPSKPSVTVAARECQKKRPSIKLPAVRTIQWTIAKMPAIERARGRVGPRALREMKAFVRRDISELWPTAVYVTDGHTHHAMVAHPLTGKAFRPEITSTVDVVTRRNVGWSVGLAENTWGAIDALRHAFATSGVPDIWYVDNGSGFNNEVIDDNLVGLLARFDVQKHNSLPYSSQARGIIERHHQTWIEAARMLPSYVGTDMDPEARKRVDKVIKVDVEAYGSSPLMQSWPDFMAWMDEQVVAYNNRPHSALPKVADATGKRRHMSPNEVWAKWVEQGWQPDLVEAEDADFRPQERRKTLRGEIQLFTNRYFAIELQEFHECDVLVSYDIHDASKVWVSTLDQRLICIASYYGNSVSYFPRSVAEQAHEKRVENRLKRVERKREAVAEEGRASLTLAVSTDQPAPVTTERTELPALTVVAASSPQPKDDGKRPNFMDDVDMVKWLLDRPDQITGHDARFLLDRLRSSTFRLRLESDDINVSALSGLLKPISSQEQQS